MRRTGSDSWCIDVRLTAWLVQQVGCENVHIRCDATDLGWVLAENSWAWNWKAYADRGLSLDPAVDCLPA